jgi:putative ABC transport system permease protein
MTIALALRNLDRNRRRSLTTLASIVVGTVALLLFGGYTRNIHYGLQMGFVRSSGHLQILHKDYLLYGSGDPVAYGIAEYQHVIDVVRRDPVLAPMLTVVTPTLQLGGIAGNFAAGVSRTALVTGAEIDGQNELRKWNDYGVSGPHELLPLTGTASNAAVVGAGLARALRLPNAQHAGFSVGPRIELLAAMARGAPNVASLSVVKAESQAVREFDDVYVGIHLAQAQRLIYGRDRPQVTAIVLQLRHTASIPAARARLERLLNTTLRDEPLEVRDYETLNPYYGQTLGFLSAVFGFISTLIGVIVLFTVSNTMSMAVVERTCEIGTLRAIGLRRAGIRSIFMIEGLFLGLAGSMLGVVLALILAFLINNGGIRWTPPGRIDPVSLTVRVWGEPAPMVGVMIALTLVSVVSSWSPARRGASINIVAALRHA